MAADIKDWSANDLENLMLDDINLSREQGGEVAKLMGAVKRKFDDVDVEIAGLAGAYTYKGTVSTAADLPMTGNQIGDVYNVTTGDAQGNYAWDGAEWDKTGDSLVDVDGARVTAKGSTAPRTLGERFADVVNVRNFGAMGDGVTDDTAAVQAAVDAASVAGGLVYIPKGTYVVDRIQVVASNVHIAGDGRGATVVKKNPAGLAGAVFQFGKIFTQSSTVQINNCSISHLEIDGQNIGENFTTDDDSVNTGVNVFSCSSFVADDLYIHDCNGYGVGLEGTDQANRDRQTVRNCYIERVTRDGIDMKGGIGISVVEGNYIENSGISATEAYDSVGIDISGFHVVCSSNIVKNSTMDGIRVRSRTGTSEENADADILISDNIVINAGQDGISGGGSKSVIISGCAVDTATRYGLNLSSSEQVTVSDVVLKSCVAGVNARSERASFSGCVIKDVTDGIVVDSQYGDFFAVLNTYVDSTRYGVRLGKAGLSVSMNSVSFKTCPSAVLVEAENIGIEMHGCVFASSVGRAVDSTAQAMAYLKISGCDISSTVSLNGASAAAAYVGVCNKVPTKADYEGLVLRQERIRWKGFSDDEPSIFASDNGVILQLFGAKGVVLAADSYLAPRTSSNLSLGRAASVWSNVYADTGPWSTSDARLKTNMAQPSERVLSAWGHVRFKVFQMVDAVEKKGEEAARLHFGVVAQDVKEAFEAEGLDAFRYGLIGYDSWDSEYDEADGVRRLAVPAGDRYSVRYEEALCLECAYQRWLGEKREERIAAVEAAVYGGIRQ